MYTTFKKTGLYPCLNETVYNRQKNWKTITIRKYAICFWIISVVSNFGILGTFLGGLVTVNKYFPNNKPRTICLMPILLH